MYELYVSLINSNRVLSKMPHLFTIERNFLFYAE